MTIPGFRLFPAHLDVEAQRQLAGEVLALTSEAPPYRPVTPAGKPMSVVMTNLGPLGWVTDRDGYRYQPRHPITGRPWPPIYQRSPRCRATALAASELVRLRRSPTSWNLTMDRRWNAVTLPVWCGQAR